MPVDVPTVSRRVGLSIDSISREYFGLFREIKDFSRATVRPLAAGIAIDIDRRYREDTTIQLDEHDAIEFARYLDKYEEIIAGDASVDAKLYEQHQLNDRVRDVRRIRVDTRRGYVFEGRIIHMDERGIILWTGDDDYRWEKLAANAYVIPLYRMDRVRRGGELLFGIASGVLYLGTSVAIGYLDASDKPEVLPFALSIGIGALAGAGASSLLSLDEEIAGSIASYMEVIPRLKSDVIFYSVQPPELRRFADSAFRALPVADGEDAPAPGRFSVVASVGGTLAAAEPDLAPFVFEDEREYAAVLSEGATYSIDATYDINQWLDAALVLDVRGSASVDSSIESRAIAELTGSAFVDVNALPRRRSGRQQFELLFGAGFGVATVPIVGSIGRENGQPMFAYDRPQTVPLAVARAQIRFSVIERLALQLAITARMSGNVGTEDIDFLYPTTRETMVWTTAPTINLNAVKVQAGVRVWL